MGACRGIVIGLTTSLALAACDRGDEPARGRARDAVAVATPRDAAPPAAPAHWTAPDLATAIKKLVGPDVRVVAFGELHARTDRAPGARSALARFDEAVLPALADRLSDLVVETWVLDPRCGKQAEATTAQVETAMQRPPATKGELATMVAHARAAKVQPHAMRLSCDDWAKVAPPRDAGPPGPGDVDYEVLLTMITRELGRIAGEAVAHRDAERDPRTLVAIYGGAMHNDLVPKDGLADWSFAAAVDQATGGRYLEIDLYVPEFAEVDAFTAGEPWLPLLAEARPDQIVVIERAPRSYIVVLPRGPS